MLLLLLFTLLICLFWILVWLFVHSGFVVYVVLLCVFGLGWDAMILWWCYLLVVCGSAGLGLLGMVVCRCLFGYFLWLLLFVLGFGVLVANAVWFTLVFSVDLWWLLRWCCAFGMCRLVRVVNSVVVFLFFLLVVDGS